MLIIVTMREEALVAFKVKVGSFKAPFNRRGFINLPAKY